VKLDRSALWEGLLITVDRRGSTQRESKRETLIMIHGVRQGGEYIERGRSQDLILGNHDAKRSIWNHFHPIFRRVLTPINTRHPLSDSSPEYVRGTMRIEHLSPLQISKIIKSKRSSFQKKFIDLTHFDLLICPLMFSETTTRREILLRIKKSKAALEKKIGGDRLIWRWGLFKVKYNSRLSFNYGINIIVKEEGAAYSQFSNL